jgi:hypothetical protein
MTSEQRLDDAALLDIDSRMTDASSNSGRNRRADALYCRRRSGRGATPLWPFA